VIHLPRKSFRHAGRQHYDAIAKALRPVYTAPTEQAAKARFGEFTEAWGDPLVPRAPTGRDSPLRGEVAAVRGVR
jgi:transposase-like protein